MSYEYIGGGKDLGVEQGDVEYAFKYFGTDIRVHPEAGELTYVEFMEKASEIDEDDELASLPVVMTFLRSQVHPDDWDTFMSLAKKKRQQLKHLMDISRDIMESVSGFPTGQPSDSRATRRTTGQKSKGISSSAGTRRRPVRDAQVKEIGSGRTERALKILKGRPDLQLAVVRAEEARSAS